jgi:hypothetical protein
LKNRIVAAVVVLFVVGILRSAGHADAFNVTVNTSPITGMSGFVVFDFLGGSPVFNNTATVSGFASDAVLGSSTNSGAVTGTLVPGPLTLTDTAFLSEWNQGVSYGTTISFQLTLSTNFIVGGIPDEYSFFLEDSTGTPFMTSDPTGADSLFAIDITGSPLSPSVFTSASASATVTPVQTTVPEPSTFRLTFPALLVGLMRGYKRLTQS